MSTKTNSIGLNLCVHDLILERDDKRLKKGNRVKVKEGSKYSVVKFRLRSQSVSAIKALAEYKLDTAVIVGESKDGKVYIVTLARVLREPTSLAVELYLGGTLLDRMDGEVQGLTELLLDFAS